MCGGLCRGALVRSGEGEKLWASVAIEGHTSWHGTVPQPLLNSRSRSESPGTASAASSFPSLPSLWAVWGWSCLFAEGLPGGCLACQPSRSWANALPTPELVPLRTAALPGCHSHYDRCGCSSKTNELFVWHPPFKMFFSCFWYPDMSVSLCRTPPTSVFVAPLLNVRWQIWLQDQQEHPSWLGSFSLCL